MSVMRMEEEDAEGRMPWENSDHWADRLYSEIVRHGELVRMITPFSFFLEARQILRDPDSTGERASIYAEAVAGEIVKACVYLGALYLMHRA